jgi:hypothetical protein
MLAFPAPRLPLVRGSAVPVEGIQRLGLMAVATALVHRWVLWVQRAPPRGFTAAPLRSAGFGSGLGRLVHLSRNLCPQLLQPRQVLLLEEREGSAFDLGLAGGFGGGLGLSFGLRLGLRLSRCDLGSSGFLGVPPGLGSAPCAC